MNKRRRELDIKILWPAIKEKSSSIEDAHDIFLIHTELDSAWNCVEIKERISMIDKLN